MDIWFLEKCMKLVIYAMIEFLADQYENLVQYYSSKNN